VREAEIALLVDRFYAKVRSDPAIGPLFDRHVADWPEHLERLSAFWSSIMLGSGRYKGSPMAAHLRHAREISLEMFDRWLELWQETALETLDAPGAAAVTEKAKRIAESLKLGLFFRLEAGRSAA
jgi:hemoglobin